MNKKKLHLIFPVHDIIFRFLQQDETDVDMFMYPNHIRHNKELTAFVRGDLHILFYRLSRLTFS